MPVFQIELEDGRKFRVDADDHESALAGIQDFLKPKAATSSGPGGMVNAVRQGAADVLSGTGETLNQYVGAGGDTLKNAAAAVAPQGYQAAPVVSDKGFDASAIPQAVAQAAPGAAASIAAARLTPGGPFAKLLSGSAAYALSQLGNRAKERAAARTGDENAQPTGEDKGMAAAAMVPEAALGGVGLSRFLPGSGKVAALGLNGVVDGAKRLVATAGTEAATAMGQDAIAQAGRTAATPGGLNINPTEVANAGATAGPTGALFGAGRFAHEAKDAVKYRSLGDFDPADVAAYANRVEQSAGDGNLKDTKVGYAAHTAAQADVANELKNAVMGIRQRNGNLSTDADNVLNRAAAGDALTAQDLAQLPQDPALNALQSLSAQHNIGQEVSRLGSVNDKSGTFKGGLSDVMERRIRAIQNPAGAAAAGLLGGLGLSGGMAAMFAHAPATLAALGGAYGAARVNDAVTGNRSPAFAFSKRFSDPSVNVRPDIAIPPAPQPQRPGATGPKIGPEPTPWGVEPPEVPKQDFSDQIRDASDLMAARRANAKLKAAMEAAQAPAQSDAPTQGPDFVGGVPKDVLSNGSALAKALATMNALKQRTAGDEAATELAKQSPFLEQTVGGADAVANPALGKRASQMVSAAKAQAKLMSDPEAEVQAKAGAKAEAKAQRDEQRQKVQALKAATKMSKPAPAPAANGGMTLEQTFDQPVAKPTPAPKSNGHAVNDADLEIPDFLDRNKPANKITKSENGGLKVTKGEDAHLTPEAYADKVVGSIDPSTVRFSLDRVRNGVVRREAVRQNLAKELAKIAPEVGDTHSFVSWLREADTRHMAREKIAQLKAAIGPERAQEVDKWFTQATQEAIWKHAKAPK
jgi:hypothetical protein